MEKSLSKISTPRIIIKSPKDSYKKWELPNVSNAELQLPTVQEIEQIETAAYEEGFKKGLADAQQEVNQRCAYLDKVLTFLQRPLDDLDEKVTDQLFHLTMTVTGQLIRRELHTEPGEIIAVVREAMASLPIAERKVNIYLHPDDASIVRDTLSLNHDSESQPWRIIEDSLLSRGGCRLQTGQSYIDASVETRLNRIIAALLGGERNSDLNVYADVSLDDETAAENSDSSSTDFFKELEESIDKDLGIDKDATIDKDPISDTDKQDD